jgi:hypothetical protein
MMSGAPGCGRGDGASPGGGAIATDSVVKPGARDSTAIPDSLRPVSRPTLYAATSLTQEDVDSSEGAGEAIGDFSFYLQNVRDSLTALGVTLTLTTGRVISIPLANSVYTWHLEADSESIGYLFVAPGRQPALRYGVMTDADILGWLRELGVARPSQPR